MEPVKGFLGRYLRRKLLEHELRECAGTRNAEMAAVVEWLPRVWLHLNKFLETHSSSDVTIGNDGKRYFHIGRYITSNCHIFRYKSSRYIGFSCPETYNSKEVERKVTNDLH